MKGINMMFKMILHKKNRATFKFGGQGYYRLEGSNLYLKEKKTGKESWQGIKTQK